MASKQLPASSESLASSDYLEMLERNSPPSTDSDYTMSSIQPTLLVSIAKPPTPDSSIPRGVEYLISGQIDFVKYNGSIEMNFFKFLDNYESFGDVYQWSAESRIRYLNAALTGHALHWFRNDGACRAIVNGPSKEQDDYYRLIKLLCHQFNNRTIRRIASKRIDLAVQRRNESIEDFLLRLEDLLIICRGDYKRTTLNGLELSRSIGRIKLKLSETMKMRCRIDYYTSFDQFIRDMVLIELEEIKNRQIDAGGQRRNWGGGQQNRFNNQRSSNGGYHRRYR